jgi:HlyD family secretion protein
MSEGLFRKAAIDKVSSPEQLDLMMRVTSPVGWLALVTVGVMIATVGVWAVVGSIADLADGRGTLFRGERLFDVKASMSGTIVALSVRPGDRVAAGQTIASLRRDRAANEQRDADAVTIEKNQAMVARKRAELATIARQRSLQQQLVNQGIKAPKDLLMIDRDMDGIRGEIDSLEAEVRQLRAQAQATADVKAAESGRIVEVIKRAGDKVREDEPLVRIEPQGAAQGQYCGGNVHAIVYVPANVAGKVRQGQVARVSPADVKKEEYGFIFGKVEWISSYPASTTDMTEKLKNDQLVREFVEGGPVFEARVCLEADPANKVNPFKWSSSQGPPRGTEAGTTCSTSIVVDERKPYTYVIPAVRKTVGM